MKLTVAFSWDFGLHIVHPPVLARLDVEKRLQNFVLFTLKFILTDINMITFTGEFTI